MCGPRCAVRSGSASTPSPCCNGPGYPRCCSPTTAPASPPSSSPGWCALHRATGDEFLGLATIRSRPGTFAMMCYASLGCPDLGTAVERGARFYRLFPGGPNLALERGAARGREAVFALRGGLAHMPTALRRPSTTSWPNG
ncbi:AraC family transcriptional regulator ligand-binding domain-containing protein [Streptomyces sp. NPDC021218]|uniref:AraC family transcriptional regulator ligand-binding domain-containing protein n=1 Tax=Streptomyces sp. NPDC021218 TaxID=3365119 RepID=UPI0037A15115